MDDYITEQELNIASCGECGFTPSTHTHDANCSLHPKDAQSANQAGLAVRAVANLRKREPLRNDAWVKGYWAALHDMEIYCWAATDPSTQPRP